MRRLPHRLRFVRVQRTPDGMGGHVETWQTAFRIWGRVRGLSATERLRAMQTAGESTHTIEVRYRGDITPDMRIEKRGETYEIDPPVDRRGDGRYMEMTARRLW